MAAAHDEVELPDDSDSDCLELPSPDSDNTEPAPSCCAQGCLAAFAESPMLKSNLADLRTAIEKSTKFDADSVRFDCLRQWLDGSGWRKHKFCGMPLCREAVCHALVMSKTVYSKLSDHIAAGFINAPADMRTVGANQKHSEKAQLSATVLLQWIHQHLAEPLVESADSYVAAKKKLGSFSMTGSFTNLSGLKEVRFLPPHTSLTEIRLTVPSSIGIFSTVVLLGICFLVNDQLSDLPSLVSLPRQSASFQTCPRCHHTAHLCRSFTKSGSRL